MVITARSPNGDKKIVLKQSSCGYFTTSKKDSSRVLFTCCGGYRRANVFINWCLFLNVRLYVLYMAGGKSASELIKITTFCPLWRSMAVDDTLDAI